MLIPRGAIASIWKTPDAAASALLVTPATDRFAWTAIDPDVRRLILTAAEEAAETSWPQPLLSQWSAFARTGDRTAYETAVFSRDRRIRCAVLAAAVDPAPARLAEAADGLWLLCEQSTWCWPAHDDAFV